MSLECCIISIPPNCNFIPFKSLSFLSLKWVKVDGIFIQSLPQLEELHLIECELKSSILNMVSSSLCHLKVTSCYVLFRNSKKFIEQFSQDCLKLTSLDYNGHDLANLNFNTPMLNNFHLAVSYSQHLIAFRLFATLPKLEILQLDIYSTVSHIIQCCGTWIFFFEWYFINLTFSYLGFNFSKNKSTSRTSEAVELDSYASVWFPTEIRVRSFRDLNHPTSFSTFAETFSHGE